MEDRKAKEIEYYDLAAGQTAADSSGEVVDFEGFRPLRLASFRYCYSRLQDLCGRAVVLDWGCGNGVHTIPIARMGAKKVIGIDLSEGLLKNARDLAESSGVADIVQFLKMDCEKTDFLDNEFDIVFDGGTFSSIDIQKALPELARILKPGGTLVGIETFGHNPLANFNRARNVRSGKRTAWAASHIFNNAGIVLAEKYFGKVQIKYFHLFSWVLIPLVDRPWGKIIFDLVEIFDRQFIKIPFFKKYAFKVVFEFSEPKKTS